MQVCDLQKCCGLVVNEGTIHIGVEASIAASADSLDDRECFEAHKVDSGGRAIVLLSASRIRS